MGFIFNLIIFKMKKMIFLALTLMISVVMKGQERAAILITEDYRTITKSKAVSNPPRNVRAHVKGDEGTLSWQKPMYENSKFSYTNEIPGTEGFSFTAVNQDRYMGFKIPQNIIEKYEGSRITAVSFATGNNGSAISGFYFYYGGALSTRFALVGVPNNAFPYYSVNPSEPINNVSSDFYFYVCAKSLNQNIQPLMYDTQNSGVNLQTAVVSTDGVSGWTNAAANRTFCMFIELTSPKDGSTYRLYGDGTLVESGITGETFVINNLTEEKIYTVTGIEPENYTESAPSTGVKMGPSVLDIPQNLEAEVTPGAFGTINLSWESEIPSGVNTIFFEEKFYSDPVQYGWLNLDKNGNGKKWEVYYNNYYSRPASMISRSYDTDFMIHIQTDNWLVSPLISGLTGASRLTYAVRALDRSYPSERYQILLSTTGTNYNDFSVILYEETVINNIWEIISIDLSQYAGIDCYIAIRHFSITNSTDRFALLIDDFRIVDNYDPQWDIAAFNIYENGVKIATTTEKYYDYYPYENKTANFTVNSVSFDGKIESGNSNSVEVEIFTVPDGPCNQPQEVNVTIEGQNVDLSWEDPRGKVFIDKYHTGRVAGISSLSANYSACHLIGWDEGQLAKWGEGAIIKQVRVYFNGNVASNANNKIKIYQGLIPIDLSISNEHLLVYQQPISGAVAAGWQTYTLTTPYIVDISKPLYIGYQYVTGTSTTNPICSWDSGPCVKNGFSNLIGISATSTNDIHSFATLEDWFTSSPKANNFIEVTVGYNPMPNPPSKSVSYAQKRINSDFNSVQIPIQKIDAVTLDVPILIDEPLRIGNDYRNDGYNVYRNENKLNTTGLLTDLTFNDIITSPGAYSYKISANYSDACDEVFSLPVIIEYGNTIVTNLTAVAEDNGVRLQWNSVDKPDGEFEGYRIFADDEPLANVTAETALIPINPGIHEFKVCAVYNNNEATKASITFEVMDSGLYPVANYLAAQMLGTMDVKLSWDEPDGSYLEKVITWTDGDYNRGMGQGQSAVDWSIAQQFDNTILSGAQYNRVNGVTTILTANQVTQCDSVTIYVVQENSLNFIAEQKIQVEWDVMKTYYFDTPVEINPNLLLYVGIKFYKTNGYPVTVDWGPAIKFYGDALCEMADGDTQHYSMATRYAPSYNFNWIMWTHISRAPDTGTVLSPIGYDIYKNQTKLNETPVEDTHFIDEEVAIGVYDYWVNAVYEEGKSRFAQGTVNVIPVSNDCRSELLTVTQQAGPKVVLSWTGFPYFTRIYRNNQIIAELYNQYSYEDTPEFGEYTYFVETGTQDNCLKQSNEVTINYIVVTSVLSGLITNSEGIAINGASISLDNATDHYSAVSAEDGSYNIIGVKFGNYSFTISALGYVTSTQQFVMPETDASYNKTLEYKYVNISGTITGKDDVTLPNVNVTFTNKTIDNKTYNTVSIIGGVYSINNLTEGNYNVKALINGYFEYEDETLITDETSIYNIQMSIIKAVISGKVYSNDTPPNVIEGVNVRLISGSLIYEVTTDSDGAYSEHVEIGTYNLTAIKSGFNNGILNNVVVNEGGAIDKNITINRNFFSFITVNVIDNVLKTPVENAAITLTKTDESYITYSASTDEEGSYSFLRLPEGEFNIIVIADDYPEYSSIIIINSNLMTFEVEMGGSGINTGEITDDFIIYPNPVSDVLKLVRSTAGKSIVEIYNSEGVKIQTFEMTDKVIELNIKSFSNGIYMIRVIDTESKGNITTQKFIKNSK